MLVDFEIEPAEIEKIKLMIDSGKYSDIEQFIQTAISNLIKRELFRETEIKDTSEIFSDVDSNILFSQEKISKLENQSIVEYDTLYELASKFNSFVISKDVNDFQKHPVISNFVTRFFPIKLIMTIIGDHLIKNNQKGFRLEDVEILVYKISELYAEKLKKYEEDTGLIRHQKLSTGLPLPESTKQGKRGRAVSRLELKISSSRERFLNHYLGHSGKKFSELKDGKLYNSFDFKPGECMLMGLLGYTWNDLTGEFVLGITKIGKQFISLNNPIINKKEMISLSKDESKFIIEKILPRFPLEKLIVDSILQQLTKKESLETNELDDILENVKIKFVKENPLIESEFGIKLLSDIKKMKECPKCNSKNIIFNSEKQAQICQSKRCGYEVKNPNSADRVAIMGRLTEMGLVEWIVGSRGKSTYKIIK